MNNVSYLNQRKKPAKKKSSASMKWNLLTAVVLLLTLGLCYGFASLFLNPYSALNPFPPPTLTYTPPPPTSTPIKLPPTWTPTPTIPPTATNTPRPTWTLEPTFTPFSLATFTPVVSPTRTSTPTKTLKPAGPQYNASLTVYTSTAFLPNSTCDSMYVAGQALDKSSTPVTGLQVRLGGSLPGKSFNPGQTTLTGIATTYGPSGFEFNLGLKPVASKESLWVQLFDQSGVPLTDQVLLTTYAECDKNLIFVRFQKK